MAIPLWKLRREIIRLLHRVFFGIPTLIFEYFLSTMFNDFYLSQHRSIYRGTLYQQHTSTPRKIAVYAIYPITGLKPSHLTAVKHIADSGYSPLIVSNATLSNPDRDLLLKYGWKLIERPNFGRDFGAYRDAILHIQPIVQSISRLALLNDSCWFPIPSNLCWLRLAEACNRDLVGSTSNHIRQSRPLLGSQPQSWTYGDSNGRLFHLQSFSLLISGPMISNPGHFRFWKRLRLSQKYEKTIIRGEVGFSQWAKRSGYTLGSTVDLTRFDHDLAAMDALQLKRTLELLFVQSTHLAHKKSLLLKQYKDSSVWMAMAKEMIHSVSGSGFVVAIPDHLIRSYEFGFLKKNLTRLGSEGAVQMLVIAKGLNDHCDFDLLSEVSELSGC